MGEASGGKARTRETVKGPESLQQPGKVAEPVFSAPLHLSEDLIREGRNTGIRLNHPCALCSHSVTGGKAALDPGC